MKLELRIGNRLRSVTLERMGGAWRTQLDGREVSADLVEITPGMYSVLLEGKSFEVRIDTSLGQGNLRVQFGTEELAAEIIDSRIWRGRRGGLIEAEGRQQVFAPMPGKVIRLLVKEGERVEANQGLLVVEAMKMQNEIRSPKTGNIERLLIFEGQTVNAGELLAVVG